MFLQCFCSPSCASASAMRMCLGWSQEDARPLPKSAKAQVYERAQPLPDLEKSDCSLGWFVTQHCCHKS